MHSLSANILICEDERRMYIGVVSVNSLENHIHNWDSFGRYLPTIL